MVGSARADILTDKADAVVQWYSYLLQESSYLSLENYILGKLRQILFLKLPLVGTVLWGSHT